MIKLEDYLRQYKHSFDWVLRRLEPDCLENYKDTEHDWVEALRAFNKFQEELFEVYSVTYKSGSKYRRHCIKGLELTADQLFDLAHKHLKACENKTAKDFIFHFWQGLRHFVENGFPALDCPWENYKPATKEEIEQARIDFAETEEDIYGNKVKFQHTFKDDANILEYRGQRYIIDNEWGDAWTKDKNGNIRSFHLVWDWWYPIDEYLDLYNI